MNDALSLYGVKSQIFQKHFMPNSLAPQRSIVKIGDNLQQLAYLKVYSFLLGRVSGQVVSVLTYNSDDPSLNPSVYSVKFVFEEFGKCPKEDSQAHHHPSTSIPILELFKL